jgi:predicted Zn-dependent peptidase
MKRRRSPGGKEAPPRPRGGVVTRSKRELEQLHLLLGLPAFPENDTLRYPLFVLNALLGGTMSSRLFQKVREERGLAYSVYSAVNAFRDTGVMMVYAGTSPKQGDELLDVILDEARALRSSGPSAAEVDVAREHLKGSIMLSQESTSSRMSNLARQEIYHGRHHTPAQVLERLSRVKREDVHRVAQRVFAPGPIALAAVGRTRELRAARTGVRL